MEVGLRNFVEELFGEETGYVYAPYLKNRRFYQQFFEWPQQKENLIEALYVRDRREVYISPCLFSQAIVSPKTFKGTRFVWTEFDGKLPEASPIEPTIRIQSSDEGYEHWYWRLDRFETNTEQIIDTTKRLAYYLEADLSAWDHAQILRPPDTFNYKYSLPKKVEVKEYTTQTYQLDQFQVLPEPPQRIDISINRSSLPKIDKLVAKYKWTDDAYDLFTKKLQLGSRSDQLARLGFELLEMGMSNEEIFVILRDTDKRCKKFYGRTDADTRIIGLISYVRSKKAIELEIVDESLVYRFSDFLNTSINLKWVIPGLLPVAGSAVIFGPSTAGKSTFALRMGMQIAAGESEFLGWPIETQQKVMFISLEMPHDELKFFIQQMEIPAQKAKTLQDNFFIWPIGHPYPFDVRDQQAEILKYIDATGVKLIIIDSLGVATYGSVSDQNDMKRLYSFLNEDVRKKRGCGYFFVHHPKKKPGTEAKKLVDFDDMYGDSYIANNAQTVIMLNKISETKVKVSIPKSRLSMDQQNFYVMRTQNRDFVKTDNREEKDAKVLDLNEGLLRLRGKG